jgi:hypothetical protein
MTVVHSVQFEYTYVRTFGGSQNLTWCKSIAKSNLTTKNKILPGISSIHHSKQNMHSTPMSKRLEILKMSYNWIEGHTDCPSGKNPMKPRRNFLDHRGTWPTNAHTLPPFQACRTPPVWAQSSQRSCTNFPTRDNDVKGQT